MMPAKPSWYAGVYPANNLASTIRNAWFAFLGSTEGFPYHSDLFFTAWFVFTLAEADPTVTLPTVQFQVQLLDPNGSVVGTATPIATGASLVFSINGSFSTLLAYTLLIEYTLPDGTSYAGGQVPIPGSQMNSAGTTPNVAVTINSEEQGAEPTVTYAGPGGHHQKGD